MRNFIYSNAGNVIKYQKRPLQLFSQVSTYFSWEKESKHFPDAYRLLRKEHDINSEKESENQTLFHELLTECGINKFWVLDQRIEKKFILTVDIRMLKKMGVVNGDITQNLLKTLTSFKDLNTDILNNKKTLTIKKIRDSVEKEFLAKKFQVDPKVVESVSVVNNPFIGRSFKSIVTRFKTISKLPSYHKQNINQNIFLLNIKPFNTETLSKFKDNLLGYNWGDAVTLFPILCSKPYPLILLYIEVLEKKGFTETQIKKALPYLTFNLKNLIMRMDHLLDHPELSRFQTHEDFLCLLGFTKFSLANSVDSGGKTFEDLQNMLVENNDKDRDSRKHDSKRLNYELSKLINLKGVNMEDLKRHPNLLRVPLNQITDTISFLKELEFTDEEISESLTIILYPRENIMKALDKISEEKDILEGMGYKDGCVAEDTILFNHGTRLKNKKLQLCLYYMEQEHGFSGNGVFYV